jgi:deoxycytidine triphosphate deaminase
MKIMGTDDLKGLLRFAPDPEGQVKNDRIVLTVLEVVQIMGEGRIDSDESNAEEARRVKRPSRKSSRDSVGNWDLTQGAYWVTYNETVQIPDGNSLILQPHEALMKNGLWHPTLVVQDWAEVSGVLLVVTARGVRIMENAPLSTGFIVESK